MRKQSVHVKLDKLGGLTICHHALKFIDTRPVGNFSCKNHSDHSESLMLDWITMIETVWCANVLFKKNVLNWNKSNPKMMRRINHSQSEGPSNIYNYWPVSRL